MRYAFGTLSLLVLMLWNKDTRTLIFRVPSLHIYRAILLLSAISLYCYSLHKLPIATVMALNFVIPIFTLIFAAILLKEKISPQNIIATICGFIGVCVIFEPSNKDFATSAALLLLLSSAIFALLDVINKRFVVDEGPLKMVFYTASLTFLFSIPAATINWTPLHKTDIILLFILGVGANLLLFFILKAFQKVKVTDIAPLRYLELLFAFAAGFFIFHEIPPASTFWGVMIIIPSTLYIVLSSNSQEQ